MAEQNITQISRRIDAIENAVTEAGTMDVRRLTQHRSGYNVFSEETKPLHERYDPWPEYVVRELGDAHWGHYIDCSDLTDEEVGEVMGWLQHALLKRMYLINSVDPVQQLHIVGPSWVRRRVEHE